MFIRRNFSTWLKNQIKTQKNTIAIVATQDEIKSGELDTILPPGLSKCEDFQADLKLSKAYWFYNEKRMLLVAKGEDKEDANVKKDWRSLGATTCGALQAKKVDKASVLLTQKASENQENLGIFANSLTLSNYENVFKKEEEPKEGDDPRTAKKTK